jgi:pilus assembly protein Flp/PilA
MNFPVFTSRVDEIAINLLEKRRVARPWWCVRNTEEILTMIRKFLKDEGGATAIEYGLIAALIAVACIVALQAVGNELGTMFNTVAGSLQSATGP